MLEGHHRLVVLRERGVDIDASLEKCFPRVRKLKRYANEGVLGRRAMARKARDPAAAARRRLVGR